MLLNVNSFGMIIIVAFLNAHLILLMLSLFSIDRLILISKIIIIIELFFELVH